MKKLVASFIEFISESSVSNDRPRYLLRADVMLIDPELASEIDAFVENNILDFENASTDSPEEKEAVLEFISRPDYEQDWAVWPNFTLSVAVNSSDGQWFDWLPEEIDPEYDSIYIEDDFYDDDFDDDNESLHGNIVDYAKGSVLSRLELDTDFGSGGANILSDELMVKVRELFKTPKEKLRELGFSDDDADIIAPFF